MEYIRDIQTLRQRFAEPKEIVKCKLHHKLTSQAREFIGHSPLMMLSTSTPNGESTVSPKGDYPGFVHVHDEQTLYIPERAGNNLLFTLQNIIENPHVGLLFMVPRTIETLRVRGVAQITTDEALCAQLAAHGQPALAVITVKIVESYFHCGKAFIRSALWDPASWGEPYPVSFARDVAINKPMDEDTIQVIEESIERSYDNTLKSAR